MGYPYSHQSKEAHKKKNGYKNMVLLYYAFENKEFPYLNFIAKLTIGVTASQKHIQYSINKIEVPEKRKN